MAQPETVFVAFQFSLINVRARNVASDIACNMNKPSNYYMEVLSAARMNFDGFKDYSFSFKVNSIRFLNLIKPLSQMHNALIANG
jgi:hypothetical protein